MPSASSCFLLSFCFIKVVRGSFSESSANLRELFSRRNKDGVRRGPAGGPTAPRCHPGAAQPLAASGSHLDDSVASSSRPFAYKLSSTRKPSIPNHIFQKTSEAAAFWRDASQRSYESMIRPICITILYHNLLLFMDIFHIIMLYLCYFYLILHVWWLLVI